MGGGELFQHQAPEEPRQHADRQEETATPAATGNEALPVKREAAAGNDHMDVGVVSER